MLFTVITRATLCWRRYELHVYGTVSVSVSPSVTSRSSIETARLFWPVFGTGASFDISHAVIKGNFGISKNKDTMMWMDEGVWPKMKSECCEETELWWGYADMKVGWLWELCRFVHSRRTKLNWTDLKKSTQLRDAFIGRARQRHDYRPTSRWLAATKRGRLLLG